MSKVTSRPVKEKIVMQTLHLNTDQTKELITAIGAKLGWFQPIKGRYKGRAKITYLVKKQAVASSRHAVIRVKESSIKDPTEENEE